MRHKLGLKAKAREPLTKERIKALHAEGLSDAEMAERTGYSKSYVKRLRWQCWLWPNKSKRHGLKFDADTPPGWTEEDERRMIEANVRTRTLGKPSEGV